MGHASILETFNTYGHLFPDAADNARRFIDQAFAKDDGDEGIATAESCLPC
jgi:hypothetical protein